MRALVLANTKDRTFGFLGEKRLRAHTSWGNPATLPGVRVYDDFAHHPTAMRSTIDGLRRKVGLQRILAVFEPRTNTMKKGEMKAQLPWALEEADLSFCHSGNLGWDATEDVLRALAR